MADESYDNEYDNDNGDEFSDDEEVSDINIDDDKVVDDNTFKLMTFSDILENISKNVKKTIPLLTKFERARIMGVRLQQLANGAKPRIDITNLKSINEIVEKELFLRKIPFIIRRTLPNGKFEDWKLEEFESV
jgi:DNA-directed RNA polymerases I, II, and III subunit RPABC2